MAADSPLGGERLAALFEVERRARATADAITLRFIVTNETRGVVDYYQAALLEPTVAGWQVTAISDVPAVDRTTPYVQWLERIVATPDGADGAQAVDAAELPEWERVNWAEFAPPAGLLVPLRHVEGEPLAWLWVARETTWDDASRFLLEHVAEVYAHALNALAPRRSGAHVRRWLRRRRTWLVAIVLIAAVLALPVHLSALAPTEIVARDATVVAAPLHGVVEQVLVKPNERVNKGQPIVQLQDLEVRNRFEVARKTLAVARAKLDKARQEAFSSDESRAEVATLRAQVALNKTRLKAAREQLDKVVIHAPRAGLAIFNDPDQWSGRPVRTGERILRIADPGQRELRVRLPVSDAIVLHDGAPLRLFLDAEPLEPLTGEVVRTAYRPVLGPKKELIYRVTARLTEDRAWLRIGLRGTARISGGQVPLAYYLFRRPLTTVRQTLGL